MAYNIRYTHDGSEIVDGLNKAEALELAINRVLSVANTSVYSAVDIYLDDQYLVTVKS